MAYIPASKSELSEFLELVRRTESCIVDVLDIDGGQWRRDGQAAVHTGPGVGGVADKLLAEIEQKAMLNYKITAKDGNKVVVVGQSK